MPPLVEGAPAGHNDAVGGPHPVMTDREPLRDFRKRAGGLFSLSTAAGERVAENGHGQTRHASSVDEVLAVGPSVD